MTTDELSWIERLLAAGHSLPNQLAKQLLSDLYLAQIKLAGERLEKFRVQDVAPQEAWSDVL